MDFFGLSKDIEEVQARLDCEQGAGRSQLLVTLAWYLRQRDPRQSAALAREAQVLADQDREHDPLIAARVLLVQGEAMFLEADHAGAMARIAAARQAFHAAGDPIGAGDADLALARLHHECAKADLYRQHLALAREAYRLGGDELRGLLVDCLSSVDAARSGAADTLASWTPTLLRVDQLGHPGLVALAARTRGMEAAQTGHFHTAAVAHFQKSHEAALLAGDLCLAINSASNVSVCFSNDRDYGAGLEWAERTRDLALPTGWPVHCALGQNTVAGVMGLLGRKETARALLEDAAKLLERAPMASSAWCNVLTDLGELALALGDAQDAIRLQKRAEDIAAAIGRFDTFHGALREQAKAQAALGRMADAQALIRRSLELAKEAGGRRGVRQQIETLQVSAKIASTHRSGSPIPDGELAFELAIQGGFEKQFSVDDYLLLARDHEQEGNFERALFFERHARTVREAAHAKHTDEMAAAFAMRYDTERARTEAAHHRALAEAEAQRADAEAAANRAKSDFLANMSHELRSPLNAMLGFSRVVLRNPQLDAASRDDIAVVLRSGEHLYSLINQVLDLSKIEAGHVEVVPTDCDLRVLLDELAEMFAPTARQRGLRLLIDAAADLPRQVRLDALKLRQVAINLLGNALKFTHVGQVRCRMSHERGQLQLGIEDTGVGIAADELALLGKPFVQAEAGRGLPGGTGLGLALCRGFASLMEGTLTLESEPGRGTSVVFSVPAQIVGGPIAPAFVARQVRGLAAGERGCRVLVADDLPDGRRLLVRLLEPLGFELREAANGAEAVEIWRQWRPPLVLMDMRMPVMDGREATRLIKSAPGGAETMIFALTASSFLDQRSDILAAGCDEFLPKPFSEEALFAAMTRCLGMRFEYDDAQAHDSIESALSLDGVPMTLREELGHSLARLDVQAIERVIRRVRGHDASAADTLMRMAGSFEYTRMRTLLAGAASNLSG